MKRAISLVGLTVVLALTTSCKEKPSSAAKVPLTPPADSIHQQAAAQHSPAFSAQLDSGNQAFHNKDYASARAHYQNATQIDSTVAAAWFGVYMAEDKLGNKEAAEAALTRARTLNPELGGASPHGAATSEKEPKS